MCQRAGAPALGECAFARHPRPAWRPFSEILLAVGHNRGETRPVLVVVVRSVSLASSVSRMGNGESLSRRSRWSPDCLLLSAVLLLAACGDAKEASSSGPGTAAPDPRPFVLFTDARIVIGRVGATVAPPTAVGSTVDASTVTIADPSVVAISPDGRLLALREGTTTVIASADPRQALVVEVVDTVAVSIVPERLKLRPGATGELLLFDKRRGARLEPSSARWSTSSPDVAVVIEGRVQAGDTPGLATVTAWLEGRELRATVEVTPKSGQAFGVRPSNPRIRVGEVVTLDLSPLPSPSTVRWMVQEGGALLHQSGPATFVGMRAGRARVCASASTTACTFITIVK